MDTSGLDHRLVQLWLEAADDLGIHVTAPAGLTDASGRQFACEALIHDFGGHDGLVVVSAKTERRVRQSLRGLTGELDVTIAARDQPATYVRKYVVDELLDCGWSGKSSCMPAWCSDRTPHPRQ